MKSIQFIYKDSCGIAPSRFKQVLPQVEQEVAKVNHALTLVYQTQYAALSLPFDTQMHAHITALAEQKKLLNPTLLVVIGIGGSNLGALAVLQAVNGVNDAAAACKVFWADTVDSDYIFAGLQQAEAELKKGNTVLLNVISKSGSTTETAANFELFLDLLKKYKKDFHNYVIATTDKDSPLWNLARQEQFTCLEIPLNVGGRYSVFSAVGMFVLAVLGIDIDQLLYGAQAAVESNVTIDLQQNSAAMSATILAQQYKAGVHLHNTFLFSNALEGVGKWYRQLMAESIGKEFDIHGIKANISYMPLVSIGSTDLHSVGQRYLAGPVDMISSFIIINQNEHQLLVPALDGYDKLVAHIQTKSLATIMQAIITGVQKAYSQRELPFVTIALPDRSAYSIGYLLQMKMIEIIYLGYLLEVNPFDQPNVELYKKETKEILSHE